MKLAIILFIREQTAKKKKKTKKQRFFDPEVSLFCLNYPVKILSIKFLIEYFFNNLLIMLYLEKPYYRYFFKQIIPTFSLPIPILYQYCFVEGHLKALFYDFCMPLCLMF